MAKIASSEVEEEETEAVEVGEAEEVAEEEALRPRPKRRRGSRVISGVTKEDFMEFARKFYPSLVKDFEAELISFEELKTRVERDADLIWVDLKE
ncbi:hypothetical protein DRO69_00865 [Candidatus Bathyarchaeota archaeon]|nr:MAG: hypothetical protein DRO69_00865 [Candidatus Bathyarchaeota archaeon]